MRLSEQREALVNSSAAPSPPANDDATETQFLTDEETQNQKVEEANILEPLDSDTPVWLVGNHCSIADISFLTWANVVDRIGIDLETEFPVSLLYISSDACRKFKNG